MIDPARQMRGVRRDVTPVEEVCATIYRPEPGVRDPHFSCLIHCPEIFEWAKRIVGVDESQALELSEEFVKTMFEHHKIELVETKPL